MGTDRTSSSHRLLTFMQPPHRRARVSSATQNPHPHVAPDVARRGAVPLIVFRAHPPRRGAATPLAAPRQPFCDAESCRCLRGQSLRTASTVNGRGEDPTCGHRQRRAGRLADRSGVNGCHMSLRMSGPGCPRQHEGQAAETHRTDSSKRKAPTFVGAAAQTIAPAVTLAETQNRSRRICSNSAATARLPS